MSAYHAMPDQSDRDAGCGPHDGGLLVAVTKGLLVVEADHTSWMIPAGWLYWLPPGLGHEATGYGARDGWTVNVGGNPCEPLLTRPAVFKTTVLTAALFARIVALVEGGAALHPQHRLIRVFFDELRRSEPEPLHLRWPLNSNLGHVAEALATDLSSANGLTHWVARLGTSERKLSLEFQAETGLSFTQWLRMARMKRGLEMLVAGAAMTDVACYVGYDNVSSFVVAFRRTFGVHPARQAKRTTDLASNTAL